eukprot:1185147-Prorocentrum_minimum.AAC.1
MMYAHCVPVCQGGRRARRCRDPTPTANDVVLFFFHLIIILLIHHEFCHGDLTFHRAGSTTQGAGATRNQ